MGTARFGILRLVIQDLSDAQEDCSEGEKQHSSRREVYMATLCNFHSISTAEAKQQNKDCISLLTSSQQRAQQWLHAKRHWTLQAMAKHKRRRLYQLWHTEWVPSKDGNNSWAVIPLQAHSRSDWRGGKTLLHHILPQHKRLRDDADHLKCLWPREYTFMC